jgi:4'-phosphopantetheinyl transferase
MVDHSGWDTFKCMQRSASGDPFGLENREVHLWAVQLDASDSDLARCFSWLSTEEGDRAGRFKFDQHRRDFVVSHGILRLLLGEYSKTSPADIIFSYGTKGKPALTNTGCSIRFNMSHSARMAVYAFAAGCEVGVDVERIRPVADMEDIAARFFSAEEAAELKDIEEASRTQGFFNCWTRKEAYIKAVGDGLSLPLDGFRVSLKPSEPAELLSLGGDAQAAKLWTLHHFVPATEYIGAIAYRDVPRPLLLRPMVSAKELLAR